VLIANLRSGETKTKEPVRDTARTSLESRVEFYIERSKSVQSRLHKICGPNETTYLDSICSRFIQENCKEDIEMQISELDKLQASIQKYENKIISLSGIGSAYEIVSGIAKEIGKVLANFEDIFCAVLLGVEEVKSMWATGGFLYQAGDDR
jgi:hypothetical protein